MKVCEVLACSFSEWYPALKKVTFRSEIIPLSRDFVDYLLADNVCLESSHNNALKNASSDEESDAEEWAKAEAETQELKVPKFEELDNQLVSIISTLGGEVFIKLNWSSPKDASWIGLNNSLKCVMPADIHLLLKSSDFIIHDLTEPFKDCIDKESAPSSISYTLILRQWFEINPGHEFRCFVHGKKLAGICQRDGSQYYPHINEEKNDILQDIVSFFKEQVLPKLTLENYVFDVVRNKKDQVILVDINPYGQTTDALLFEWEELLQPETIIKSSDNESSLPEFRFLQEEIGVRTNPLRQYGIPLDIAHLTSGEDPFKLIDLLNLRSRDVEISDDSD